MNISFHGAARTVTGSKHLLTLADGFSILMDCGMFQGLGAETDGLNREFGFEASSVNAVLLSHAHIDHSGLLPKLVKEGFKGNIYCTAPTADLATILLEDSANIQKSDTSDDRKEESVTDPFYDIADVEATLPLFKIVAYDQPFEIHEGVSVMFTDAGHLAGSAAVHLTITENEETVNLTFSGDVGRSRDAILCPPTPIPQADYLILESTYGDSQHESSFRTIDNLMDIIKEACVRKQGKLIIPAFSVGRTQELLFFLNQLSLEKRLPDIPVIVDSPLGFKATQIIKKYPSFFNDRVKKIMEVDDDPFDFPHLHFTQTVEDSRKICSLEGPAIVIAASGMASAGRVRHHIADCAGRADNTILIVGFCDPSSLGGQLRNGAKQIHVNGRDIAVKAKIEVLQSMSAHGDYTDLCNFISGQDKDRLRKIFLVHGEYGVQCHFQQKLHSKGFEHVAIPALNDRYELTKQAEVKAFQATPVEIEEPIRATA
jgi:metallo-beta-lactamase family protein